MAKKAAGKKTGAPARAGSAPATAPKAVAPQAADGSVVDNVPLTLTIELGRTREPLGTVQEMNEQSLVELDKTVGEPVDVRLNGELWARGEVVTVGENFGVKVVEVIQQPGG